MSEENVMFETENGTEEMATEQSRVRPLTIKPGIVPKGLISVIVPVYNVGEFLRDCLESLISQTYRDIEVIVVDDGSEDESKDIADEYAAKDSRIKVIHKKNAGVSEARNDALKVAKGDYITFVDADDWVDKDTCKSVLTAMQSADANVCFFNIMMAPQGKNAYLRSLDAPEGICDKKQMMQEVLRHYYPCVNNKCFRRDVIFGQDGQPVLFDRNTRILEDGLWLLQTCSKWKDGVLLKTGFSYRRLWSGSTLGNPARDLQNRVEFMQTFQKLLPLFAAEGEDLYAEAKEYYMNYAMMAVRRATWKSNREWLLKLVDEMSKVDEHYVAYMYADMYNMMVQIRKNSRQRGGIVRLIKKMVPYRLKQWIKSVLAKLKSAG